MSPSQNSMYHRFTHYPVLHILFTTISTIQRHSYIHRIPANRYRSRSIQTNKQRNQHIIYEYNTINLSICKPSNNNYNRYYTYTYIHKLYTEQNIRSNEMQTLRTCNMITSYPGSLPLRVPSRIIYCVCNKDSFGV